MTAEVSPLVFDTGKEVSVGMAKLTSSSGLTPVFEKARNEYFSALLNDRPNYDSIQFGIMERVSYLHARIKQKEQAGGYSSEQNYTMANKTLNDTLSLLLKTDAIREDREKFQQDFMSMVADAVKFAIKDLDSETQKSVMFLLSKRLEEVLDG